MIGLRSEINSNVVGSMYELRANVERPNLYFSAGNEIKIGEYDMYC